MIFLHNLESRNKQKKKRVGRGNASGHGTYCGRGVKGQKARSKYRVKAQFEGGQTPLIQRLPKLKGFKSFKISYFPINVSLLSEKFEVGDKITKSDLVEKGILKKEIPIKILGNGDVDKKLTIFADKFSKSAQDKIKKLGGKIRILKSTISKDSKSNSKE